MFWLYLLILWLLTILSILVVYHRDLQVLWQEPVLRHPVLIVESDDWGAGPSIQTSALERLISILNSFRDSEGRHPVMTLALVLAVADGKAFRASGEYRRRDLSAPEYLPLRTVMSKGVDLQVFALQLHGMEHYWPDNLMTSDDPDVRDWLLQDGPQATELLPPHLQSRWVNSSKLPSTPLDLNDIQEAAHGETSLFARLFSYAPKVVVPPTFVWDERTESAWADNGIEIVVTPGLRNQCRDAQGAPGCSGQEIHNGDQGKGVNYLVRNDYFEPERGHTAEDALLSLKKRSDQGRPCLLETHRSNFIGEDSEQAYEQLQKLLVQVMACYPSIRFMSSLELGQSMLTSDPQLVATNWQERLAPWVLRLKEQNRFWKLARVTGLALMLGSIARISKRLHQPIT